RSRLASRRTGDVRVLVDERERGERRRCRVGLVPRRFVPVEKLPRSCDREENEHRSEETAKIKMERAQEFHCPAIAQMSLVPKLQLRNDIGADFPFPLRT